MPKLQRRGNRTVYIAMGTLLLFALGIGSGMGIDEIRSYRSTQTMSNVLILKAYDLKNYRLQTEWGQAFNVTLCDDSSADWQAGEQLSVWNYKQNQGCKSMNGRNLGYISVYNQEGIRVKFPLEEISDVR